MLKKLCLILFSMLLMSGCAAKEETVETVPLPTPTPISEPLKQKENKPEPQPSQIPTEEKNEEVDIDLTPFNNNMMYAEVMNMTLSPQDYNGKTIRLRGEFSRYSDMDENGQPLADSEHLLCIVFDTMGCCAQGVELKLKTVPDSFPENEQEITVSGICNITMDEYEFTVFELTDAVIE